MAMPSALLGVGRPRSTPRSAVVLPCVGPCTPPVRPLRLPLFGNARLVVLPSAGSRRPFTPHSTPRALAKSRVVCTMRASISTCGCGRSSERTSSAAVVRPIAQVAHDERVGARVDLDFTARRESAAGQNPDELGRFRIAQWHRRHTKLSGERLHLGQLATLFLFGSEHRNRRDADNGAIDDVAELVGLEDDVERLIPGHVTQRNVDHAGDAGVDDDVQPADLGEGAQHGAQIGALKVERDGVALKPRWNRLRRRSRLLSRRGGGRRNGAAEALDLPGAGASGDGGASTPTCAACGAAPRSTST